LQDQIKKLVDEISSEKQRQTEKERQAKLQNTFKLLRLKQEVTHQKQLLPEERPVSSKEAPIYEELWKYGASLITQLEKEIASLNSKLSNCQQERDEFKIQSEKYQVEIQHVNQVKEELLKEQNKAKDFESKLMKLRKQQQEGVKKVQTLQSGLLDCNVQLAKVQNENKSQSQLLTAKDEKIGEARTVIKTFERRLSNLTKDRDNLQVQNNTLQNKVHELELEIANLNKNRTYGSAVDLKAPQDEQFEIPNKSAQREKYVMRRPYKIEEPRKDAAEVVSTTETKYYFNAPRPFSSRNTRQRNANFHRRNWHHAKQKANKNEVTDQTEVSEN